ncbi:DUF7519 family protein [Natronobiforma cellulositropha]|uniref:DUF7519 family protein n=1 Tax=Natronobiforma cellulositropha TaxID=1679076 RepID=UPI0021D5D62B|nr:hypothetical protein [Natronobiforma cellulositropha]
MSDHLTRRPTRRSSAVALGSALLVTTLSVLASTDALALALLGTVLVALALARTSHALLDVAGLTLFLAVVLIGYRNGSVELTLLATVAVVVAWDLGHSALDLGETFGWESTTARLETVHAVSSALIGLVTVTFAYTLYLFAAGGQPVAAVALLLVAATLVTIGLGAGGRSSRRRSRRPR